MSTVVEVAVPKQEHKYVIGQQGKHLKEIFDITGNRVYSPLYI